MVVLRKFEKTGLKATTYETIINIEDKGSLRAIRWQDPDAGTDLCYLKVTIDGDIVLEASKDLGTAEDLNLIKSIAQNSIVVSTDEGVISTQKIPFHSQLKIEYKRATAGATGLSITSLVAQKDYFS